VAAPGEAKRAVAGDADGESPVKALGDGAHSWAHLGVGLLAPWGRLEHDVEDGQDLLLGVHLAEQCGVDHLRAAWGRPGPSPWRAPSRASHSCSRPLRAPGHAPCTPRLGLQVFTRPVLLSRKLYPCPCGARQVFIRWSPGSYAVVDGQVQGRT